MGSKWDMTLILLLLWYFFRPASSRKTTITDTMGSVSWCQGNTKRVLWISEDTSALISGKSESSSSVKDCQFIFGLASPKDNARILLNFDFIYIHDCGVYLQVNESQISDFDKSETNQEIFFSKCNTRSPGQLFARPKHYILVRLVKENKRLLSYNFHLNISMAEQLPLTGPPLHTVIIVGFVMSVLVIVAFTLVLKYVARVSHNWHKQETEQAMSRAISIYHSQEAHQEPVSDMIYFSPLAARPGRETSNGNAAQSTRPSGANIVFVHNDGRVERFRTTGNHGSGQSEQTTPSATSNGGLRERQPHRNQHGVQVRLPREVTSGIAPCIRPTVAQPSTDVGSNRQNLSDLIETASIGGSDLPPSYEEALEMPAPKQTGTSEITENLIEEDEDNDTVAIGGRLELDYMNVRRDSDVEIAQQDEEEQQEPQDCGSGDAFLSSQKH